MTIFQKAIVLLALLDASYTDTMEQKVSDRVLLFLFLAIPSGIALLYTLFWASGLWYLAQKTNRIGTGDIGVLALLSGICTTEVFAELCLFSTILLSTQRSKEKPIPLMPALFISAVMICCITR